MKFVLKILVLVGLIIVGKYLKEEEKNTLANGVTTSNIESLPSESSLLFPAGQSNDLTPTFNQLPATTETNSTTFKFN